MKRDGKWITQKCRWAWLGLGTLNAWPSLQAFSVAKDLAMNNNL